VIFRKLLTAVLLSVAFAGCRAEPAANASQGIPVQAAPARAPTGLELVPLECRSRSATHRFTVEVARTPEEQGRGLMFRESLADDAGMIFPFRVPQQASFWMRNTLIPLDMIFIRQDGTIESIAANTVPRDETSVRSGEPVIAVLELRGGRAAELGIVPGDRVSWPG
jgi:uncharacterized membrane protein (UPF0127 family)